MPRKIHKPVQQFRGTTAQHATYTGPIGELTVDTDKKVVVVQDGATAGGIPMAREDRKVAGDNYIKVNNAAEGTLAADLTLTVNMTKVAADLVSTDENNGLSVGTDNKLSVPEYVGATASTAGTSGLVPTAAAGQADYVLCGDGEWRDIKTLVAAEALRKTWIGIPRPWRSTTLPEGFAWVNGDLIFFEDRPEFEEVYLAGGFEGMLLEANATSEQIAANLGKFRKHPNGLGLYLPSCGGQFFRGWTGAGSAGEYNAPGLPEIEGAWSGWNIMSIAGGENAGAFQSHWEAAGSIASATKEAGVWDRLLIKASRSNPLYGSSTTVMPASVNLPVILYLGISA